jgi:hypothetical protein
MSGNFLRPFVSGLATPGNAFGHIGPAVRSDAYRRNDTTRQRVKVEANGGHDMVDEFDAGHASAEGSDHSFGIEIVRRGDVPSRVDRDRMPESPISRSSGATHREGQFTVWRRWQTVKDARPRLLILPVELRNTLPCAATTSHAGTLRVDTDKICQRCEEPVSRRWSLIVVHILQARSGPRLVVVGISLFLQGLKRILQVQ